MKIIETKRKNMARYIDLQVGDVFRFHDDILMKLNGSSIYMVDGTLSSISYSDNTFVEILDVELIIKEVK